MEAITFSEKQNEILVDSLYGAPFMIDSGEYAHIAAELKRRGFSGHFEYAETDEDYALHYVRTLD